MTITYNSSTGMFSITSTIIGMPGDIDSIKLFYKTCDGDWTEQTEGSAADDTITVAVTYFTEIEDASGVLADGVYCFRVIGYNGSTSEQIETKAFIEVGQLACSVTGDTVIDPDCEQEDLILNLAALSLGAECADCDCENLCTIFEQLNYSING